MFSNALGVLFMDLKGQIWILCICLLLTNTWLVFKAVCPQSAYVPFSRNKILVCWNKIPTSSSWPFKSFVIWDCLRNKVHLAETGFWQIKYMIIGQITSLLLSWKWGNLRASTLRVFVVLTKIAGLCCVLRYVLWHWNSIVPMLSLLSEFTWVLTIMINVQCLWFFLPFVYWYIIPSHGVYGILQNIEFFNCSVDAET